MNKVYCFEYKDEENSYELSSFRRTQRENKSSMRTFLPNKKIINHNKNKSCDDVNPLISYRSEYIKSSDKGRGQSNFIHDSTVSTVNSSLECGNRKEISKLKRQIEQIQKDIDNNKKIELNNNKKIQYLNDEINEEKNKNKLIWNKIQDIISERESIDEVLKFHIDEFKKTTYKEYNINDGIVILTDDINKNDENILYEQISLLLNELGFTIENNDYMTLKNNLHKVFLFFDYQSNNSTSLHSSDIVKNFINVLSQDISIMLQNNISFINMGSLIRILIKLNSLSFQIKNSLHSLETETSNEKEHNNQKIIDELMRYNKLLQSKNDKLEQLIIKIKCRINMLNKKNFSRSVSMQSNTHDISFNTLSVSKFNYSFISQQKNYKEAEYDKDNSNFKKSNKSILSDSENISTCNIHTKAKGKIKLINNYRSYTPNQQPLNPIRIRSSNTICYFKVRDEKEKWFNPLKFIVCSPEKDKFLSGIISINFFTKQIKFSSNQMNTHNEIVLNFVSISNILINKKFKDILSIHKEFKRDKEKEKEKYERKINKVIQMKKFSTIKMDHDEKIKSALCHYFPFVLIYNGSCMIEVIFVNFDDFKNWYTGISMVITKAKNAVCNNIKCYKQKNICIRNNKKKGKELVYHFIN